MGEQSPEVRHQSTSASRGVHPALHLVLAIVLVCLGGLCWTTYDSYRGAQGLSERALQLQQLRGIILSSNEALSVGAAMFGATGDPRWEQRYGASKSAVRQAIERAGRLSAQAGDPLPATARDGAEISLGRIEAHARQLVGLEQSPEGQQVFPAEAYGEMEELYAQGMRKIDQHLQRVSQRELSAAGSLRLQNALFLMGLVPVLLGAWIYMLRALQHAGRRLGAYEEEAVGAAEERDQFLSRMSHSLRSPLTSVLGYADLLLETDPSREERDEYLRIIRRNGEDVLTIMGDQLDLSQLKTGKGSFELIEISPFDIMHEVLRFTCEQAEERSLEFVIEYEGKIPERIETDLERVRQVMVTLVSNAIQFTEAGRIRIGVRLVRVKGSEPDLLEFKVTDTGRGMTPQQTERIFDPYSRSGKDARPTSGGTGLGMAISRELARRLGGDLTLESSLGEGTCVTFTIDVGTLKDVQLIEGSEGFRPAARTPAPAGPATPEPVTGLNGMLLVAEDATDVRLFLENVLRKAGLDVEMAEDGQVAYQKAISAWERGEPFDVVLMDMQMPILSGFDATTKLREKGYQGPIIAITSHALEGDRERCMRAGCDAYTTKPIDRQHLLRTIAQHLAKPEDSV